MKAAGTESEKPHLPYRAAGTESAKGRVAYRAAGTESAKAHLPYRAAGTEGAKGRVGDIRCFDDNEALVKELEAVLREGDAVMIKASNSMKFGDVAKALMGDG